MISRSKESLLSSLGFKGGVNGPHAARTMMLEDLQVLLAHVPAGAACADYAQAVVDHNVLGKPTKKARELAWRHLSSLYGFEADNPIFRALRRLWALDTEAQPMLALAVAIARDALLRATQEFFLKQPVGAQVRREDVERLLAEQNPNRFSPASLKSFAQNVSGTWTAAGILAGRAKKTRTNPVVKPENVALCLFLGYLEGRTGQRLFSSSWMSLLCSSPGELEGLANLAYHRGHLVFMNAGGVKEVRFPDYLTNDQEQIRLEVSHVV